MKNILATILIFLGSVLHAEENPLGITFFGSFLHTDRVPNALFFFSDIQRNDSFELRRALRTHEIDTIVLASPGGSVWEGLNMAGIIFDKKMTAYVPQLPEEKGCYSACAYMFFAGQTRLALGELGVHQIGAYDAGVDSEKRKVGETQQATQFTTSEVIGFLNEFGTPPWVYERMFRSREIYVFTEDEKRELNQGQLDPSLRGSIDVFLGQLRAELEKAANTEPKTSAAEGFDKTDKEMVKAIQLLLNEAKCSAGVADGVWGGQTNAAAERFAKANNLEYAGHTSIDNKYITTLSGAGRKQCPPPPKAPTYRLAKNWDFKVSCKSGPRVGYAKAIYKETFITGTQRYELVYTISGNSYSGWGELKGREVTFQIFNADKLLLGGRGTASSNFRVIKGQSTDGCSFVGSAR